MGIKNYLAIIFFLTVLTVFRYPLSKAWAVPASYQAIQDLKEAEQRKPEEVFEVPQVEYTAENLRDPFEVEPIEMETEKPVLPVVQENPFPTLDIQGIIWGGQLTQAIINNRVVKIGDIVEGVRIVDISKDGIKVFYDGRQQVIAAPAANMLESQSPKLKED